MAFDSFYNSGYLIGKIIWWVLMGYALYRAYKGYKRKKNKRDLIWFGILFCAFIGGLFLPAILTIIFPIVYLIIIVIDNKKDS